MPDWSEKDLPDLKGKMALVTGANIGLGFQTSLVLAAKGADVHLAGRSKEKIDKAVADIKSQNPSAKVEGHVVDLAKLSSVKAFAEGFRKAHPKLDMLINNAGVGFVPKGTTEQGWDTILGTNHFGTVFLTQLLLPSVLAAAPGARIVFLSSMAEAGARAIDWNDIGGSSLTSAGLDVYGQSKLFNGLYSRALLKRLGGRGVSVFAVHPGFVQTDILSKDKMDGGCLGALFRFLSTFAAVSPAEGAKSTLFAAAAPEAEALKEEALSSYIGPDQFNRGMTQPRRFASKHYSEEHSERLLAATLEEIRRKGFEVPDVPA